jgi:flagella basal body P-ring formation protein FlgA
MQLMKKCILFLLCLCPTLLYASVQDHDVIRSQVSTFVQQQTAGQPGKMSYQVDEIDRRLVLQHCGTLETFLPSGSMLIGKTSVGVRCKQDHGWTIFVPVQIKLTQQILINARQLPAGHVMSEADLTTQSREVSHLGGLIDPEQVLGKVLRYSISAGQMLRTEMLRVPYSVKQGQTVQLLVQGDSFSIRSSGVALNDASDGQLAKVRSYTGGVINGVAHGSGVVEIAP